MNLNVKGQLDIHQLPGTPSAAGPGPPWPCWGSYEVLKLGIGILEAALPPRCSASAALSAGWHSVLGGPEVQFGSVDSLRACLCAWGLHMDHLMLDK